MKTNQISLTSVFLVIGLFFIIMGSCVPKGPYLAITVRTGYGEETIPSSCVAWNDGCTIYCRTNVTKDYKEYAKKDKCNEEDIARSRCINYNYKTTLPEGFSLTDVKDQCI